MSLDEQMLARSRSFGSVAAAYERLRPGYPEALFDDLLAHVTGAPLVLEIGAGTGKATFTLLERGLDVVALEPSLEMAELLRERAAGAGLDDRLRIELATFEEIDPELRFEVVVAAQSFHWVDPATRWQRLADVLQPGGTAGLFWNAWMLDPAVHDHDEIRRTYAERGPGLRPDVVPFELDDNPPDGMDQVPALVDFQVRRYEWTWTLDTPDYLDLLATTSQYAVLDDELRETIRGALGDALGPRAHLLLSTELMLVRRVGDR